MKRIFTLTLVCILGSQLAWAQEESKDISEIIDALTIKWDAEAVNLESYEGLTQYCKDRSYRIELVKLLNTIHHYDTVLYQTVKAKYEGKNDPEAKATLDDIDHVELKYTTKNFLDFLHKECNSFNDVERNYGDKGGKKYEKESAKVEAEAARYIDTITRRIDLIDEHVHHLTGI